MSNGMNWMMIFQTVVILEGLMNTFTITLEIKTYSDSPEDWIAESIVDQLEEDEELISLTVGTS